jgi:DNA mismatch repair protein MutS2
MHPGAWKALEFDRILEALGTFALTPLGAARILSLCPTSEAPAVRTGLAATTEGVRYLSAYRELPLRAPSGLQATLDVLAVDGPALEARSLIGLADFLASIEDVCSGIGRARGGFSLLGRVAGSARSFTPEVQDIRRKIDPSGEVVDTASPALRSIRDRLRRQRTRLRTTLESYLRGRETVRYLQDQIVTERNGRQVLVVKSEHRLAIPGIIHGSSASGASLYLEPLSTVEINNEVVALEEEEREEVRRILAALTDLFRRRERDLHETLEAATELDLIQAKARFSTLTGGVEPVIAPDGRLELLAARHPLLIPAVARLLRDQANDTGPEAPGGVPEFDPVPVDLRLVPPTMVLAITGPNTGGKTVALKTAGLLALMAQTGLHVPAVAGSQLPVFRSIFADIGDEQSIAASLSTFSGHVANIVNLDRQLALPALVLLDEIGAGTDPVEGSALGMAILDHLRQRGALVLVTTHYEMLKSYASTTDGVTSAAFGFDPVTFAPTYELVYGSPGRSLALEIAARLGLAPSVVETARRYRGSREAQLADHLARLDQDLSALERQRRALAERAERLEQAEAELRARARTFDAREEALRVQEAALRRRREARLDEHLREARREVDRIVGEVKRRGEALAEEAARQWRAPGLSTGQTGALRSDARAAFDRIAAEVEASDRPDTAASGVSLDGSTTTEHGPVALGDRVLVGPLGLEGIIRTIHGSEAEIDVRGKRLRVPLSGVQRLSRTEAPPPRAVVSVQLGAHRGGEDLNVIGCTVDEAIARAEKFLDDALVAEHRTVRLIHGHGGGHLRRAIATFLQDHPLVEKFSTAPPEHGGSGVTVVELKD